MRVTRLVTSRRVSPHAVNCYGRHMDSRSNIGAIGILFAALATSPRVAADHPSGGGSGGEKPPAASGGSDKPAAPTVGDKKGGDDDHSDHDHGDAASEEAVFKRGAVGIAVHALPIASGFYGVGADLALNDWMAVGVVAQYYRRTRDVAWSGGGAEVGAQFFVVGSVFRGLYVAPRIALHSIGSDDARVGGRRWVPGGGATVGFQWAARVGLSIRVGVGFAVRSGSVESDRVSAPFDGAAVLGDGAIGWVF